MSFVECCTCIGEGASSELRYRKTRTTSPLQLLILFLLIDSLLLLRYRWCHLRWLGIWRRYCPYCILISSHYAIVFIWKLLCKWEVLDKIVIWLEILFSNVNDCLRFLSSYYKRRFLWRLLLLFPYETCLFGTIVSTISFYVTYVVALMLFFCSDSSDGKDIHSLCIRQVQVIFGRLLSLLIKFTHYLTISLWIINCI